MSTWNYRIMAREYAPNMRPSFGIYEVYYEDEVPNAYSSNPIDLQYYDDAEGIKWDLEKMLLAYDKSILWYGDKFPEEYKHDFTTSELEDSEGQN